MTRWSLAAAGLLALGVGYTAPAHADAGQAAFQICAACHSVKAGENKIGPSLHGIVGSKAGTVAGFDFSPAMKKAGFVWTPEKLAAYINDPQAVVPGNRMPYAGTHNMKTAQAVVAYLEKISK